MKQKTKDQVIYHVTLLSEDDLFLFNQGSHFRLYEKLGAHRLNREGLEGTCFAVWAPDAEQVCVTGDFNEWNKSSHPLRPRGQSGIWEGFIPGVGKGTHYKYHIQSRYKGYRVDKADPFSLYNEVPPQTASILWNLEYIWEDRGWMLKRAGHNSRTGPLAIYEMHLGSWMRVPEEENRPLTYREIAPKLTEYIKSMGFTHVEFLPVMEHPFYGSWGYQISNFFAPTSRYGTPQDFMYLIDRLHQEGIGVILDWVPSHIPNDEHGLGFFDGTHLYEHEDPRQGIHPDWNSFIFNYGRNEVRSFLLSNALFWLETYHADGLRVDAVASMLYLDYSRKEGEWIPNEYGGRENLEAISFLRRFNKEVYKNYPQVQTIAEESTSWPMVSRPTYVGGLGFGLKWDMGWMHDTLSYFALDPIYRRYNHNLLTFRGLYGFTENYVLPISHDEVVHGKGSLLGRMSGDEWQKFANLRTFLAYMYCLPGKKLLFMGCEFGQRNEWYHEASLDWHLLSEPAHAAIRRLTSDLNALYRSQAALHETDAEPSGFEWLDANDAQQSTLSFLRLDRGGDEMIAVIANLTPVPRHNFRIGVPRPGAWTEVLNTDATIYGGSGEGNLGQVVSTFVPSHGHAQSLVLTLPPLAVVAFRAP